MKKILFNTLLLLMSLQVHAVTTTCSTDSETCTGAHSSLFAISHTYSTDTDTVLMRVKVNASDTNTQY